MFIEWPLDEARGYQGPLQKIVVELKLLRTAFETTLADEAYLLIFDRRPDRSWDERIWQREESHAGRTINVSGM